MSNKFSVIAANYNNGKFLPDLIESVRRQTYTSWELIITDDFSTDNSLEVLERYRNDERIKIVKHHENKGAAAAFRTAVENSTGNIIGMLGADDALLPTAVEEMVQVHCQYPDAALICSNLYRCDEQLNIVSLWDKYSQPAQRGALIQDVTVGSFATFKKKAYDETEGFDPYFKKALDHDIYLKLEEKGEVIYIEKPLYLYRSNPIGISQNNEWMRALQFSTLAKKNAFIRRRNTSSIVNLSWLQYTQMMQLWHRREAQYFYRKKKLLPAVLNLGKTGWYQIKGLV